MKIANNKMERDNSNESVKRNNLSDLSKEELVCKCKNLISVAQKAKQAKDALHEENVQLKNELVRNEKELKSSQVIIENLTQQKLSLVTTVDELKNKNATLENRLNTCGKELRNMQEKLSEVDNENVVQKRQITRLNKENEQLLENLDQLEKQSQELKCVGIEQRDQLLELEKKEHDRNRLNEKILELQSMLKMSLDEVKKSKTENHDLTEKNQALQAYLLEKDKQFLQNSNDLSEIQSELLNKYTDEFGGPKLECSNGTSCEINLPADSKDDFPKQIEELEKINESLRHKIKTYHSKLVKFAGNVKCVKNEKNQILTIFMVYTDQVKLWKDQLNSACQKLSHYVRKIELENSVLNKKVDEIKAENTKFSERIKSLAKEKEVIAYKLEEIVAKYDNETKILIEQNERENAELKNKLIRSEKDALDLSKENELLQELKAEHEKDLTNLKKDVVTLEKEINTFKSVEEKLAEQSSEEILKLLEEIKVLKNNAHRAEKLVSEEKYKKMLIEVCTQTTDVPTNEHEEQLRSLQRENSELLKEMNEMNQELKERGETISKLGSHCDEIMKKLQIYETQANRNIDSISEKDEIIVSLKREVENASVERRAYCTEKDEEIALLKEKIEVLNDKLNTNLDIAPTESDTMSTSTISRTEELCRLKDFENSWEERYSKLRNLAVKLKGKLKEQATVITNEVKEKEELQNKCTNFLKTIENLQSQIYQLEEELKTIKKNNKMYLDQLNSVAENISKDKQTLVSNEDIIETLKKQLDGLKAEKIQTENWKKQISAKVQTLRKELEANSMLKKEYENKITNLNTELESKDNLLKEEIENHKKTKNLLEQSKNDCMKSSVLNLEMQDYERSVKELSQKLEKKSQQINNLQAQIDTQKSKISALREQNKILEERVQAEQSDLSMASTELNEYKKKMSSKEEIIRNKEEKIVTLIQQMETLRSENEELSTELSKLISEHQKSLVAIKAERDHYCNQNAGLQQSLRYTQDCFKLKEDELEAVRNDYEEYKLRALSVLRQNQNRDVGFEEKLSEEVEKLNNENAVINDKLVQMSMRIETLESTNVKLSSDKEELQKKKDEQEYELEDLKNQLSQLSKNYQKALNEYSETVRSLKLHAETLSQCYRQQISEQEVRHNREIIELQSRLDKAPSPTEPPTIPPCMPREEGEGSESVESNPTGNTQPISLERLLCSDFDQEVVYMRKQLTEQESKLSHLTALLSDTEQDLAKYVQMNKLLKEEIRRQQRSEEREKHAENLEYLKNVVFKFVTLNSGDERSRLLPVLNTILKLSPEESQKLSIIAKGEHERGWSNYLPIWTSPNKPK